MQQNYPLTTQPGVSSSRTDLKQEQQVSASSYNSTSQTPRLSFAYSQHYGSPSSIGYRHTPNPNYQAQTAVTVATTATTTTTITTTTASAGLSSPQFGYYANPQPSSYASTHTPAILSPEIHSNMAAPHTMRPHMAPLYHPSQHAVAPALGTTHDHSGRPLYSQYQGAYVPPYQHSTQMAMSYTTIPQQHQMQPTTSSPLQMHHTQQQHQHQPQQHRQQYHTPSPQSHVSPQYGHPSLQASSTISQTTDNLRALAHPATNRLPSQMPPPPGPNPHTGHTTGTRSPPGSSHGAAPGPIPATTPVLLSQDEHGVEHITFEYSRDRVKVKYTIRTDVDSVDGSNLSREFKELNCVYPRACSFREEGYKGNRYEYESQCNSVGWSLASLNPELRGKRGLIQRAVDSFRNTSKNTKLQSRRVRRLAKTNKRTQLAQQQHHQQQQQHQQAQAQHQLQQRHPQLQLPTSTPSLRQMLPPQEHLHSRMNHGHHAGSMRSEPSLEPSGMQNYQT